MRIKDVSRSGITAWSPDKSCPSLTIGATSQQFDSFSSDCKLEVHDLNIKSIDKQTVVRSSLAATPFVGLVWHPQAIVGATQNKTLQAFKLDQNLKLHYETSAHHVNFSCLDLNADINSIASGSADGTIQIWSIDSPELKSVLSLNQAVANEEINTIKWNHQVKTILASASNANVYVWDTRKSDKNGPIMRVHDCNAASIWGSGPQSLMISQALSWSPVQSTSLVVANSNDSNPFLQVWDLRYATCPVKNVKGGHSRGIVSVSWNSFDEHLFLSAGKDNIVCLWDLLSYQNEDSMTATLPGVTNQWINHVDWCLWEPALFLVNSFDGHTTIYNITSTNSMLQTNSKILESFALEGSFNSQQIPSQTQTQPIIAKAPSWFRVPCGASFGFGNKLIKYDQELGQGMQNSNATQQKLRHLISISQVVYDSDFIKRVEKLENALANHNLVEFCNYKLTELNLDEKLESVWKLILLRFESNRQVQLNETLKIFGFDCTDQHFDSTSQLNSNSNNSASFSQEVTSPNQSFNESYDSEQIITEHKEISQALLVERFNLDTTENTLGSVINQAILNGNFSEAVENCIATKNWTEALLICQFLDNEYLSYTLKKYFEFCSLNKKTEISTLLWIIIVLKIAPESDVNSILEQIFLNVNLRNWREVLTFAIKELNEKKFLTIRKALLNKLADRLISQYLNDGDKIWLSAALYCNILNGDYKNLSHFKQIINFLDLLEILLILYKSSANDSSIETNELTEEYACYLVREGKLELALKYLGNNESELKQRIIGSLNASRKNLAPNTQRLNPIQRTTIPSNISSIPNVAHGRVTPMNSHISSAPQSSFQPTINPNLQQRQPQSTYNYTNQMNTSNQFGYGPPMGQIPVAPLPVAPVPVATPASFATLEPNRMKIPTQQIPTSFTQNTIQQPTGDAGNFLQHQVTPGWNDPPMIKSSGNVQRKVRTISGSFDEHQQQPPVPIFTPTNTFVNPSPTPPPDAVNTRLTRKASLPTPREIVLSPQNKQIYDCFEMMFNHLMQSPQLQNLNTRRKLEDVKNKLDTLKVKLSSEAQLSAAALEGLNGIAHSINNGDYNSALMYHNNLVTSSTFSETAAFLPAIKVMLHLAQHR